MKTWFLLLGLVVSESISDNETFEAESHSPVAPCNPLTNPLCVATNLALAGKMTETFGTVLPHFDVYMPRCVAYVPGGVRMGIAQRFDNPILALKRYILFGKISARVKAAPGRGVITLMYLQSDDLDEVDVELFGGAPHHFQSNFFIKGNVSNHERGRYHTFRRNQDEHFYEVEWTPDFILWLVDHEVVRKVHYNNGHGFPRLPMRLIFSLWAGGDELNDVGTVEWAGGSTNYAAVPFYMYVSEVSVEDYSRGSVYRYAHNESLRAQNGRIYSKRDLESDIDDVLIGNETLSESPNESLKKSPTMSRVASPGRAPNITAPHETSGASRLTPWFSRLIFAI